MSDSLYLPRAFQGLDESQARLLAQSHPLAALVTVEPDGDPFVSHLPLLWEGGHLIGHLARANPHSRILDRARCLAIFHGPDAYVSPSWYGGETRENVPTWNYSVLHLRGVARVREDAAELTRILARMAEVLESGRERPWAFARPSDLHCDEELLGAILPVAIEIEGFELKLKLSQNRSDAERVGVWQGLRQSGDSGSLGVARAMEAVEVARARLDFGTERTGADPVRSLAVPVRRFDAGSGALCERILRSLPAWFGIEQAIRDYARAVESLPTWVAEEGGRESGFLSVRRHGTAAAEIAVMAVLPERHRRGLGRALVLAAEAELRASGCRFLTVKTLAPSRVSPEYDRTRRFYQAVGFHPLEVLTGHWGAENPCLMMVRAL